MPCFAALLAAAMSMAHLVNMRRVRRIRSADTGQAVPGHYLPGLANAGATLGSNSHVADIDRHQWATTDWKAPPGNNRWRNLFQHASGKNSWRPPMVDAKEAFREALNKAHAAGALADCMATLAVIEDLMSYAEPQIDNASAREQAEAFDKIRLCLLDDAKADLVAAKAATVARQRAYSQAAMDITLPPAAHIKNADAPAVVAAQAKVAAVGYFGYFGIKVQAQMQINNAAASQVAYKKAMAKARAYLAAVGANGQIPRSWMVAGQAQIAAEGAARQVGNVAVTAFAKAKLSAAKKAESNARKQLYGILYDQPSEQPRKQLY